MKRGSFAEAIVGLTLIAFVGVGVWYSLERSVTAQTQQRVRGVGRLHAPAANTQATISAPASTNGRNVADCVQATFTAGATAPTAVAVQVNLRDGATGAGTIVHAWAMGVPAVAGQAAAPIHVCGLNIFGSTNTAMTLEFAAAGGANTIEAVSLVSHVE